MKMLSSRSVWMRNARVLNDFSEIQYGLALLDAGYRKPIGDRPKKCISSVDPSVPASPTNLAPFERMHSRKASPLVRRFLFPSPYAHGLKALAVPALARRASAPASAVMRTGGRRSRNNRRQPWHAY